MKIQFCGAAQTVTGSKHLITTENGTKILLDCGLFQGIDTSELNLSFAFDPKEIDVLILSHAHIDHTGLIPRLVKLGFRGPIYATPATKDLCEIMLLDSAHIQQKDLERINERRSRQGRPTLEQLYDERDVQQALRQFEPIDYRKPFAVSDEVTAEYYDAAHILGSAGIFLTVSESNQTHTLFFTGDVGRPNDRILRLPEAFPNADTIICESTYGSRLHEAEADMKTHLLRIITATCVEKGGKVIIPAFSVDRTQELIYALDQLYAEGKLPEIPVFVDSKLSVAATKVMAKHEECFNPEILAYIKKDGDAFSFKNLTYITESEESKKLNELRKPCVIISASGMAEAGRVKHHIKNGIENPNNTILIVGYCSPNSLGGALKRGDQEVKIFGEMFQVRATVEVMDSFSAHADYSELIDHLNCQTAKKQTRVFLVHGELETQEIFAEKLRKEGFGKIDIPTMGQEFMIS